MVPLLASVDEILKCERFAKPTRRRHLLQTPGNEIGDFCGQDFYGSLFNTSKIIFSEIFSLCLAVLQFGEKVSKDSFHTFNYYY